MQTFEHVDNAIHWVLNEDLEENFTTDIGVLTLLNKGKYNIINTEDIYYIFSEGRFLNVVTKDRTYRCRMTLKNILKKLPKNIQQAHRSYLINLKKLDRINYYAGGSYLAYLKDFKDLRLPVGRKYAPAFKIQLGINKKW